MKVARVSVAAGGRSLSGTVVAATVHSCIEADQSVAHVAHSPMTFEGDSIAMLDGAREVQLRDVNFRAAQMGSCLLGIQHDDFNDGCKMQNSCAMPSLCSCRQAQRQRRFRCSDVIRGSAKGWPGRPC